jgi:5'-3' exonuclease
MTMQNVFLFSNSAEISNVQFPTNQQNIVLVGNMNKNVFIIGSVSEIPNNTSDSNIYIIGTVTQQQLQQQQLVVEEQQSVIASSVVQQPNRKPSKKKTQSADEKARINARRRELYKLRKEEALRIEYADDSDTSTSITSIEVTTSDTSTEAAAAAAAAETDMPYDPLPQSVIDQIIENKNKIFETVTTATSVEEELTELSKTFDTGRSIIIGRILFFEAACDRLSKFDPMIDDYWKLVVEADPLLFREIYDR